VKGINHPARHSDTDTDQECANKQQAHREAQRKYGSTPERREKKRQYDRSRALLVSERLWRHKEYNQKLAFKSLKEFFETYEEAAQSVSIASQAHIVSPIFTVVDNNGKRRVECLNDPLPEW